MITNEIVRSWKDEDYRLSLSREELASTPDNPVGLIELTDEELIGVDGGTSLPCGVSVAAIGSAAVGASVSFLITVAAITIYRAITS